VAAALHADLWRRNGTSADVAMKNDALKSFKTIALNQFQKLFVPLTSFTTTTITITSTC
jgi:hypothetical protein